MWQRFRRTDLRVWAVVAWVAPALMVGVAISSNTLVDWAAAGFAVLFAVFVTWIAIEFNGDNNGPQPPSTD